MMTELFASRRMRRHSHATMADSAAVTLHVTATSVGCACMRAAARRVACALWSSSCLSATVSIIEREEMLWLAPVEELEGLLLAHAAPRLRNPQAAGERGTERAVIHKRPGVEVE